MTCLGLHSKHLRKMEKWWFKESKTFIGVFLSCSQPEKQLLSGPQRMPWRMLISIPEHWKLPVTDSKKGLQPGKEQKKREKKIRSIELISLQLTRQICWPEKHAHWIAALNVFLMVWLHSCTIPAAIRRLEGWILRHPLQRWLWQAAAGLPAAPAAPQQQGSNCSCV